MPTNRTFRQLPAAQVAALSGTALASVAPGLFTYLLAGANVGVALDMV